MSTIFAVQGTAQLQANSIAPRDVIFGHFRKGRILQAGYIKTTGNGTKTVLLVVTLQTTFT